MIQPAQPTTTRRPYTGWVVMAGVWAVDFSIPLMGFSLGVMLPEMTRDLSLRPVEAGLLGSSMFLAFALGSLPASIWLSRFSPRRVTLLAILGMAAFSLLQGLAPSYELLLVARFLFMAAVVCRVQAAFLLIQQWFEGARIATVNGITVGVFGLGQMAAIGGTPFLLLLVGNWRGVYLALAGSYLAILLLWIAVGREQAYRNQPSPGPQKAASPLAVLRRHPALWLVASCQVGGAMAFSSFLTFFPTYGVTSLGLSLATAGALLTVFPLGQVLGSFSAGPLSNLLKRRKPLIVVPGFVMPLAYLAILNVPSPATMVPFLLVLGVCGAIVVPILFTIPYDLGLAPREVVVALGLMQTITPFGAALGPVTIGAIQEATGSLPLALSIVLPLSVTVGILALFLPETSPLRRQRSQAPVREAESAS